MPRTKLGTETFVPGRSAAYLSVLLLSRKFKQVATIQIYGGFPPMTLIVPDTSIAICDRTLLFELLLFLLALLPLNMSK